jgi:mono/diheme cytochrome c family protein
MKFIIFRFTVLLSAFTTLSCGVGDHMPVSNPGAANLQEFGHVDYKKDLLPVLNSRCARCHNQTSPPDQPNWLDENTAAAHKAQIYQHVWIARDMPPSGNITEHERGLIAAWARGGEFGPQSNSPGLIQSPTQFLNPTVGKKGNFGKDPVSRGEYLTRASDCLSCHTTQGAGAGIGAGGVRFKLSFGDLYTPNITPDYTTGIGSWSANDFYKAVHDGIRKGGAYLYPAFPFTSYTKMSRREVDDIYAYLRTLKPVSNYVEVNHLRFPYKVRESLYIWRALYFKPGEFVPDETQSKSWNRGKYLVSGPGHCEACHTPRNFMGAPEQNREFAGAEVDNWFASNLRYSVKNGISQWTTEDLVNFLGAGSARGKATVVGPMAEVVSESLQYLTLSDLQDIALFLKTISSPGTYNIEEIKADLDLEHGKHVYLQNCAKCHQADGLGTPGAYPPFFENPVVNQDDSTNLVNVLLLGVPPQNGYEAMPSFWRKLTDAEMACVANFIRVEWGSASQPTVTQSFVREKRAALFESLQLNSGRP